MSTDAREIAIRIVQGLDQARAASSQDNPVDEVGLIEAAIDDALDGMRLETAVRDRDMAELRAILDPKSRREKIADKRTRAIELKNEGKTYRQIARSLGYRSPSAVHRILNEPSP